MTKETATMTSQTITAMSSSGPLRRAGLLTSLAASACLLFGALGASTAQADFGFLPGSAGFDGSVTNQDGSPDTQAGSHPYEATTSFNFNMTTDPNGNPAPDGNFKDGQVGLPPGFVGNPTDIPQCQETDLDAGNSGNCSDSAQVGTITLFDLGSPVGPIPVYNMVPPPGMPAQFGFTFQNIPFHINISIRTGGDYGVTASVTNASQAIPLTGSSLTLWGVPAASAHDSERGLFFQGTCGQGVGTFGDCPSNAPLKPLLTLPTSCVGPQTTTIRADRWQDPGNFINDSFISHDNSGNPIGADGCNRLDFRPSITVQPDTTLADTPAGLHVDLHLPQNDNPDGLAEADLKTAVVTLPQGVSVSPSAASGLAACSPRQISLDSASEPSCPDASKIGSVEVDTPALPNPLTGGVYLAQQSNNPFGSLLAIYVTAEDPVSGVLVKLAGHVVPDPVTGQLQTTFDNNPQLPFSDFKLDFFGGPRGALATPETCGTFTTTSELTPWTAPDHSDAAPSDSFAISSGCVSGFSPSFTAGVTNPQAGAYSPFVLSFQRSDTDQDLSGLSVKLPPGMLAELAGVAECSDADLAAAAGKSGAAEQADPSCPAGSQVGTVETGAGPGPDPFFLPAKAYLTGPYKGGPYGLAVVVPALAGPYDLGTVVVRQALYIDPTTAQVTAVSDPFPTILDGIPLRLRRVDVTLNRPSFTLNPTSCNPMAITGALTSAGGLTAPVSSRFQVAGCKNLLFKPRFSVSTSAKTSRQLGAALHVQLSYPNAPFGSQANIRSVKVDLPKQLPSRLTTLQKACPDSVFNANPAGCPAASIVGHAKAVTPVLPVPLEGPAYFVSHGGEEFPDLIVVLQGYGVTVDLVGTTFIKNGTTSSTFKQVPDVPVGSFELTLPQGKFSALAANGNLCKSKLKMPTAFTAQNGAVIHQSTPISVTGCPKHKKAKKRK